MLDTHLEIIQTHLSYNKTVAWSRFFLKQNVPFLQMI